MLADIKGWVAKRMLDDLTGPWEDVVRAWAAVLADGRVEDEADRRAIWTAVDGVQAAIRTMESALKEARGLSEDPALRRALSQTVYATGGTKQLVEELLLPEVEKRAGYRPPPLRD